VTVKCLAQEHNTMSTARARTRTARSGDERTNHETNRPQHGVECCAANVKCSGSWKYGRCTSLFTAGRTKITNENNKDFGVYCGQWTAKVILVTGDLVVMTFHSNAYYNHYEEKGFLLSVTAIPPGECSQSTAYFAVHFLCNPPKMFRLHEYSALMESNEEQLRELWQRISLI